ncbi:unnamed protein product, partial [Lymnaea stagnalis]
MYSTSSRTSFIETINDDSSIDDVFKASINSHRFLSHESSISSHESSINSHKSSISSLENCIISNKDWYDSVGTIAYSVQCDTSSGVTSAHDESLDAIYFESRCPRTESTHSLACSIRTGSTWYPGPPNNPVRLRPPPVPHRTVQKETTTLTHQGPTSRNHSERLPSYEPHHDCLTTPLCSPECRLRNRPIISFQSHCRTSKDRIDPTITTGERLIVSTSQKESIDRVFRPTGTRSKKRWRCCKRRGPKYNKPRARTKTTMCLLRRNTIWTLTGLSLILSLASCGLLVSVELGTDAVAWNNTRWREESFEICLPCNHPLRSQTGGDWVHKHDVQLQCCTKNVSHFQSLLQSILNDSNLSKDCKRPAYPQASLNTKVNMTENIGIARRGWYYVYSKVHFKQFNCSQSTYLSAEIRNSRHGMNTTLSKLVKTYSHGTLNSSASTSFTGGLFELYMNDSLFVTYTDLERSM